MTSSPLPAAARAIRLLTLQREGKGVMDATTFPARISRSQGHKAYLMPRYRLTLEYDGSAFYGWQIQLHDKTIQGVLTDAIARINGEPAMVQGAGRTDAGVHALGQVAHVDLSREWDPFVLRNAINAGVRPHKISVLEAELVPDTFNARFSGTKRHYLYRILNRRAPPTLDLGQVWFVPVELDAGAMHEAAQILVGHHDFSTFRDSQCQAQSPMRTLDRLDVSRFGEFIEIRTESRSFLHSQVRSMVGSLKLVGEGKWKVAGTVRAALCQTKKRCAHVCLQCGRPAEGSISSGLIIEIGGDDAAIDDLRGAQFINGYALVNLVDGGVGGAKFQHRAIILDEAGVRGAA